MSSAACRSLLLASVATPVLLAADPWSLEVPCPVLQSQSGRFRSYDIQRPKNVRSKRLVNNQHLAVNDSEPRKGWTSSKARNTIMQARRTLPCERMLTKALKNCWMAMSVVDVKHPVSTLENLFFLSHLLERDPKNPRGNRDSQTYCADRLRAPRTVTTMSAERRQCRIAKGCN